MVGSGLGRSRSRRLPRSQTRLPSRWKGKVGHTGDLGECRGGTAGGAPGSDDMVGAGGSSVLGAGGGGEGAAACGLEGEGGGGYRRLLKGRRGPKAGCLCPGAHLCPSPRAGHPGTPRVTTIPTTPPAPPGCI